MNKLDVAKTRAEKILSDSGVSGWGVWIRNTRKELAVADHNTKTIELSKRFILLSTLDEFDGVMHHEIAHVFAGFVADHNREFVSICRKLNPNSMYSCDQYPIYIKRYLYTCRNCGVLGSSEEYKKIACSDCFDNGKVVEVDIKNNKIETKEWASTP